MRREPLQRLKALIGLRAMTLSTGLVLLTLCVLLMADLSGLRGGADGAEREAREALVETLSVRLSVLAGAAGPQAVEASIAAFVDGSDQVIGAELVRLADGRSSSFGAGASPAGADRFRRATLVAVPIVGEGEPWGELRLLFRPIDSWREDLAWLAAVAVGLFAVYLAYLGKALVQLDPSRAIPERVDTAFNMLSEGVIVLDERLRVLMANAAAARIAGRPADELVGQPFERWPWIRGEGWQAPWATVLRTGLAVADRQVAIDAGTPTSYTLGCSLIRDAAGEPNGLMVTLNDLSAIERKNRELSGALGKLRRSQESITRKNRELEALALQDPLTGLNNRRAVMDELTRRLDEALATDAGLACIMVDIDHFKRINDTLGHAVGDEVICAVASTLVDHARDGDTVGRIGGEEFVVVLPATSVEAATLAAERIRVGIERLAGDVTVPVDALSASLGVAAFEPTVTTVGQLLDRADQALYLAKNGGRNRVVAFDAAGAGADAIPAGAPEAGATSAETARERELARALDARSKDLDELRTFDPVTGLPRREVFVDRLERCIADAERTGTPLALLTLGLRDAERLAASLGHEAWDEFLRECAHRLRDGLGRDDAVFDVVDGHGLARIGGTEFGVLLAEADEPDAVLTVLSRVRRTLSAPITAGGTRVHAGVGIGAAFCPGDAPTAAALLERANAARATAMAESDRIALKFAGGAATAPTRASLEMESDLYEAIERQAFEVHYQPKLDLVSRRVCGLEALVRWSHPIRGPVSPAEFIPLAERSGLIDDIGAFVTRTALAELRRWHDAGFEELGLAINVSAVQLRDPELVPGLLRAIDAAGVESGRVEIELTETAVIASPQRARIALGQMRRAGMTVSMDDFGTGYTSLALLADLPLDQVKIDGSFVDAMVANPRSRAVVASIVDMAHALGLSAVGEGVETNEQLDTLAALGCDQAQGYLIGRPAPADEITAFLERHAHGPPARAA